MTAVEYETKARRGMCSRRLNLLLQNLPRQNFHEYEGHSLPRGKLILPKN